MMSDFNWEKIKNINADELTEESTDLYYEFISETEVDDVTEPSKLQHAFNIAQAMLILKFEQHKLLLEEFTEKDEENIRLKNQYQELEKENADLQKLGSDPSSRGFIQEKRDWEIDRNRFEEEVNSLNKKLDDLIREKDELSSANADLKSRNESLSSENNRLNENLNFMKTQNEQLREKSTAKGDDVLLKKELANLRAELRARKAKIDSLEEENHKNFETVEELEKRIREATILIETTTEEYREVKALLKEQEQLVEEKELECTILKNQVAELSAKWNQRGDSDDQIMVALNQKVEEWKDVLADRDAEIVKLYQDNRHLRQELQATGVDSDRASMAALFKALKEKEEQIQMLENQLTEATKEMERDTKVIQDMQEEMNVTGRGPNERQAERIRELRISLKDKEDVIRDLEKRRDEMEKDIIDKDREIFDVNERMRRYEDGEYGLGEAVAEIKTYRAQVSSRDRQIEELCNMINKAEMNKQELKLENEHLRTKLGIGLEDDLNIEGYKRMKLAKEEEDKGLNLVLQKEIELLEEERRELKAKLRLIARQAGIKAAASGLSVNDILDLDVIEASAGGDDMIVESRSAARVRATRPPPSRGSTQNLESSGAVGQQIRVVELNKELDRYIKEVDNKGTEVSQLQASVGQLEEENKALTIALREISDQLKDVALHKSNIVTKNGEKLQIDNSGPIVLECPSLDKLLSALDAKRITGDLDTGLYMKARVDNLEGRNDELRKELREHRVYQGKLLADLERQKERLQRAEEELKAVYDIGGGQGGLRTFALPEGITPNSAEIISALSEHLVQVLQELSNREEAYNRREQALEQYRRRFAVCRHQQGLLYKQYVEDKKNFETEKLRLEKSLQDIEGMRQEEKVRLQEFDRLIDSLGQDDVEVRRRLGEQTRQLTVLRVNECALIRRYQAIQEIEQTLRRENNRLRNEQMQMEAVVMERIGYYQRYREMAAYRVASLQKTLDDSVPRIDLTRAHRQLDELTERHRAFLEAQNSNISRLNSLDQLEVELKQTRLEHENVKKMLLAEKERRSKLEVALDEWNRLKDSGASGSGGTGGSGGRIGEGYGDDSQIHRNQLLQLSQKVNMLEMKELNERERAEHAQRLYENLKLNWAEVERRNRELEDKFSSVSVQVLEQQKTERQLRDELANSVTREIYEVDRKRLMELEKSEMNLKHEVDKLKEISDIAVNQCQSIQSQQILQDKELTSLRQQLLDIQCQTDEKALIGKLHRHIVQMQLSESTSLRKYEEANRKIHRLESQILRQDHKLDDREQSLYHTRLESRNRVRHLRETISNLRQRFAGSIPLKQQEKFTESLLNLQRDKSKAEEELRQARQTHEQVTDELDKLKIQHQGLQELLTTLKDGRGAAKVMEWQSKMEQLRLDELKYRRQVERLRQQLNHLESVVRSQESQLCQLEEENVRLNREWEERQLLWEQREGELERALASLESVESEVVGAANRLSAAAGGRGGSGLPDPNQPIATQLEHAVNTIKKNLRTIFDQQTENNNLKNQLKVLQEQVKVNERDMLKQERLITELRLRLPASADRDHQFNEMSKDIKTRIENGDSENYVEQKTIQAAQTTIQSLQTRLQQKEASLLRYQENLNDARQEMESITRKHAEEILHLQQKLNSRNQEAIERLKDTVRDLNSRQKGDSMTNKQMSRLAELEELIVEYSRKITELNEESKSSKRLIKEWQQRYDQMMKASETEKEMIINQQRRDKKFYDEDLNGWKVRLEEKQHEISLRDADIVRLQEELKKSPSAQTRALVQRLKSQLDEKERQHQALSKALMELRHDMVNQASETLRQTSQEQNQQGSLQKILEKHSEDVAQELLNTQEALQKANSELKRLKDNELGMESEIQDLKDDKARKEGMIQRLKGDKNRIEKEKEELTRQLERIKNVRRIGPGGSKQNLNLSGSTEAIAAELDLLRRKCHLLEDENRLLKEKPEKPYEDVIGNSNVPGISDTGLEPVNTDDEQPIRVTRQGRTQSARVNSSPNRNSKTASTPPVVGSFDAAAVDGGGSSRPTTMDAVAQWEENKRLGRVIEKLKESNKGKEGEIDRLNKQLELTRNALDRSNKEKEVLEKRVTQRLGPAGVMMDLPESNYGLLGLRDASPSTKVNSAKTKGPAVVNHNLEDLRKRCFQLEEENERLKRQATEKERNRNESTYGNDVKHRMLQERIDQLERQLISKGGLSSASMERERSMQKEIIRLNEENLEMKFELQSAHKEVPRSKKRIEELEKYIELLKAEKAAALENSTVRSFDSNSSITVGNLRRIGESGKSTKELEKTVARLKKVIERVQAENERLKTAPGIITQDQVQWLRGENESLKQQLNDLREQMGRKLSERYDAKDRGVNKLANDYDSLKIEFDKEIAAHNQTKSLLRRAEQELEDLRHRLELSASNKRSMNYSKTQNDIENESRSRDKALGDMRKMLKDAAERELAWNRERDDLQRQLTIYQTAGGLNSFDTSQFNSKQSTQNMTSSKVRNDAENEKLLRENIELRVQLNQLSSEKSQIEQERNKGNNKRFGTEIAQDLEEMKQRHRAALDKNDDLRLQLQALGEQFGVSVRL